MDRDPAIASWSQKAEAYDNLCSKWPTAYRLTARQLVSLIPAHSSTSSLGRPLRLLDLGCGSGLSTEETLLAYPEAVVYCVEPSLGMCELARQRFAQNAERFRNVRLIAKKADELDLASDLDGELVDVVLSNVTVHYMSEAAAMSAVAKILRPSGGLFIFNLWGNFYAGTAARQIPTPHFPAMEAACQEFGVRFVNMFAGKPVISISQESLLTAATANGLALQGEPIEDELPFPISFYIDVSCMTSQWPATEPALESEDLRKQIVLRAHELGQAYPENRIFSVRFVFSKK